MSYDGSRVETGKKNRWMDGYGGGCLEELLGFIGCNHNLDGQTEEGDREVNRWTNYNIHKGRHLSWSGMRLGCRGCQFIGAIVG